MTNSSIATKSVTITFDYKPLRRDSAAYEKLMGLVNAGKLSEDDIIVVPATDDLPERYKRKSVAVETTVPVITIDGFTPEQNAHVEYLVTKQLEAKNKDFIDTMEGSWLEWDAMLQAPAIQRGGGVKVTKEMIAEVVTALRASMEVTGYPEKAIELTADKATKKFTAAALSGVPTEIVEKFDTIIKQWVEELTPEAEALVEPVTSLWLGNIDSVLNPVETEISADLFDL